MSAACLDVVSIFELGVGSVTFQLPLGRMFLKRPRTRNVLDPHSSPFTPASVHFLPTPNLTVPGFSEWSNL